MKNLADVFPNKRVHVTILVHVDERRSGGKSDVDTIERIVCPCLLHEDWIRGAAGIFEIENVAGGVPNKRVHVTIVVHIDERRNGGTSDLDTVERIVRPRLFHKY